MLSDGMPWGRPTWKRSLASIPASRSATAAISLLCAAPCAACSVRPSASIWPRLASSAALRRLLSAACSADVGGRPSPACPGRDLHPRGRVREPLEKNFGRGLSHRLNGFHEILSQLTEPIHHQFEVARKCTQSVCDSQPEGVSCQAPMPPPGGLPRELANVGGGAAAGHGKTWKVRR